MEPSRNLASFLYNSGSIYHINTDLQGRYTYANLLYKKIFLGSAENIIDESFQDFILPDDIPAYRDAIEECTNNISSTACIDLRRTRNDGSQFWIRWEFAAILENGSVTGIQALGTDASERKRAEQEKKEAQEKLLRERYLLRTLIDHLPDYIYVKDKSSRYIITNKAQLELIGASSEAEVIGKSLSDFINDESTIGQARDEKHLLDTRQPIFDREEYLVNRKGEKLLLQTTRVPLINENDEFIGFVGISRDITEKKRLEEELVATTSARQRLVTEATLLAQEKERADIGRELHDNINQILSTTKMYLDMALTEKEISDELILKSLENISTAVEEIRSLSKSLVPPSLGDIGLKEAVSEMLKNLKYSPSLHIKLKTTGFSKTNIPGDIQLSVFRIIQEQVNNVLKHAKATEAEVKLTATRDNLSIVISDNGVGFDAKKRMKGIGLMNITSRVEVHKGEVEIISSPGNGCTLKISIPI